MVRVDQNVALLDHLTSHKVRAHGVILAVLAHLFDAKDATRGNCLIRSEYVFNVGDSGISIRNLAVVLVVLALFRVWL